ncbi:MerR family transcriptional regulator [Microbacterium trichothecenolyticum]|uniref:DNA-binding transcriptional MerR regulator n=1 Tax=Microbacterium trichothecenolyticum TaxID=69370 RepID=A0ABU0TQB1_MICTR|nr:MerR family transcriptional regulator [Microbacterium trichothecenolyticum]MDQ1121859.1 DNA-binding transcriptional MerR regulator [Microbacterium trichothecenolyticum]
MSTKALIDRLLDSEEPAESVITALHELLDDATAEDADPVPIAEASALTGLSAATLRYYEAERLVCPARAGAGYRAYRPADLRRLVFLTRMRLSGMGMRELKRYIRLVDDGEHTVAERRQIMIEQRDRIRTRMRELHLALAATEYKIASYGGAPAPEMPKAIS